MANVPPGCDAIRSTLPSVFLLISTDPTFKCHNILFLRKLVQSNKSYIGRLTWPARFQVATKTKPPLRILSRSSVTVTSEDCRSLLEESKLDSCHRKHRTSRSEYATTTSLIPSPSKVNIKEHSIRAIMEARRLVHNKGLTNVSY